MSELTIESLELKQPLDKMTVKELKQLAMSKIPQITGASGMEKGDLLAAIKELLGIAEGEHAVSPYKAQISGLKRKMRELRATKLETAERKLKGILRRRINRLKKHTRRMAHKTA